MRAACENCGKLGEMEPGKPFVCAVCGHYHDPRVVGSRIAAEKKAAERKAEADRIARKRAEREAAERAARDFRPKPTIGSPRPSPPRSPPRAIREIMHGSRSSSCLGGCISAFVKLGIGIFVLGMIIGSCLSSKPAKNISPPVKRHSPGAGQEERTSPSSPTQGSNPVATLPQQPAPKPKAMPKERGSSAGQKREVQEEPGWIPGMRHPKQSHARASDTPGEWILDEGYEFVHPGTSDWTVRKIAKPSPCIKCSGTGIAKSLLKCSLCNGRKTYPIQVSEIDRRTGRPRLVTRRATCPACSGTGGTYIDVVCPKCDGTKVAPRRGR